MPFFPAALRHRAAGFAAALLGLALLAGCDAQRISELQPGQSTEADVRDRFGLPENTWPERDGGHTLEYNRQPAGSENFMITIAADGTLVAVRQVLTQENFARVQAGMSMAQVRRLLGKPAKTTHFALSGETHVDWRYLVQPDTRMLFTVVTGNDGRVLRTQNGPDLSAVQNQGGGR